MPTRLPTAAPGEISHDIEVVRPRQSRSANLAYISMAPPKNVGFIHEMSQPLSAAATFISAGRRLLKNRSPDQLLVAETMESAEKELKRAREVLVRLRSIPSEVGTERLPVNLFELTRTIAEQLRDEAKERAVRIRLEPGSLPALMADAKQIRQVLFNLLNNAIDAAAETSNGVVDIRCYHDRATIEIEVNDNGKGIASEIAEHVFEPFRTTKPCGLGLGLPLSLKIVEAHGGQLWWESVMPQGTRFHLRLPFNADTRYGA